MKIIIIISTILLLITGCATPESLKEKGASYTFTASKTPQELHRCLLAEFDQKLGIYTHILRETPENNFRILSSHPDEGLLSIIDINREDKLLNILIYTAYCDVGNCDWHPFAKKVKKALTICGAKETAKK
jgi:hypothetical protein